MQRSTPSFLKALRPQSPRIALGGVVCHQPLLLAVEVPAGALRILCTSPVSTACPHCVALAHFPVGNQDQLSQPVEQLLSIFFTLVQRLQSGQGGRPHLPIGDTVAASPGGRLGRTSRSPHPCFSKRLTLCCTPWDEVLLPVHCLGWERTFQGLSPDSSHLVGGRAGAGP